MSCGMHTCILCFFTGYFMLIPLHQCDIYDIYDIYKREGETLWYDMRHHTWGQRESVSVHPLNLQLLTTSPWLVSSSEAFPLSGHKNLNNVRHGFRRHSSSDWSVWAAPERRVVFSSVWCWGRIQFNSSWVSNVCFFNSPFDFQDVGMWSTPWHWAASTDSKS